MNTAAVIPLRTVEARLPAFAFHAMSDNALGQWLTDAGFDGERPIQRIENGNDFLFRQVNI